MSGTDDSRITKLNQIVQNFFPKVVQIVTNLRINSIPAFNRDSNSPKINRWFNLEIEEIFKDDLRPWRNIDVTKGQVPPLIIETYLDLRRLSPQQIPILVDCKGKKWNATKGYRKNEIVLERWIVEFDSSSSSIGEKPDIPVLYKWAIVTLRSLYSRALLLPCYTLRTKLSKSKLSISPLSIGCRVLNGMQPISSRKRVGLTNNIADNSTPHQDKFSFTAIETQYGKIEVSVFYRTECDFRVSDSEALLSTHFLDLDHSRQESSSTTQSSRNISGTSAEMPSNIYRPSSLRSGSGESVVPSRRRSTAKSPEDTMNPRSNASAGNSPYSQTRPTVSFVHPFKSPSVAASPNESALAAASPKTPPFSRVPSNSSVTALRIPTKHTSPRRDSVPEQVISSSMSSTSTRGDSSLHRYSSSFGSRALWPRSGSISGTHSRPISLLAEQSSVGSDASMEPGSGLYVPNQDLGDFVKMVDFNSGLFGPGRRSRSQSRSASSSSSDGRSSPQKMERQTSTSSSRSSDPLSRFKLLRSNHTALSESLQSSVYVSTTRSESSGISPSNRAPSVGGVASVGTSASTHTPVIPSRLSEAVSADAEGERQEETEPKSSEFVSSSARVGPMDITASPHKLSNVYRPRKKSSSFSSQKVAEDLDDGIGPVAITAPANIRGTARSISTTSSSNRGRSRSRLSISGRQKYHDEEPTRGDDDDELLFAMSDMQLIRGHSTQEQKNSGSYESWNLGRDND